MPFRTSMESRSTYSDDPNVSTSITEYLRADAEERAMQEAGRDNRYSMASASNAEKSYRNGNQDHMSAVMAIVAANVPDRTSSLRNKRRSRTSSDKKHRHSKSHDPATSSAVKSSEAPVSNKMSTRQSQQQPSDVSKPARTNYEGEIRTLPVESQNRSSTLRTSRFVEMPSQELLSKDVSKVSELELPPEEVRKEQEPRVVPQRESRQQPPSYQQTRPPQAVTQQSPTSQLAPQRVSAPTQQGYNQQTSVPRAISQQSPAQQAPVHQPVARQVQPQQVKQQQQIPQPRAAPQEVPQPRSVAQQISEQAPKPTAQSKSIQQSPIVQQPPKREVRQPEVAPAVRQAPATTTTTQAQRPKVTHTDSASLPEHLRLPPGFRLGHSVRTDVETTWRPAVTKETIINERVEIIQQAITRDIHVHHYHTYVQPIKIVEILPAKHFHLDVKTGIKKEIPTPEGWVPPDHMKPTPEPDAALLKSFERHYLVDEEHPEGMIEDPPLSDQSTNVPSGSRPASRAV